MPLQRYESPRGSRLRALEQNILRYRALEMVLGIFYAEELRHLIIDAVTTTDRLSVALKAPGKSVRIPPGTKKPLQKAINILVGDGMLTDTEKDEIRALIDYRNKIAHAVEELMADIATTRYARDFVRYRSKGRAVYDYDAVQKMVKYRKTLSSRLTGKYAQKLSFKPILFDGAEQALGMGLGRLRRTIDRQFAQRQADNAKLERELDLKGTGLERAHHPGHFENQYDRGTLTPRGVEICYRLFDLDRSPEAVAYLMRMSLSAAKRRRRSWEKLGGKRRPARDLDGLGGRTKKP